MKLLVTGGAGFIGSAVVARALAQGHHVINVDALTYAAAAGPARTIRHGYKFEHVDIRDADALGRVFRDHAPDAVLHLAAESHVDRSIDGPAEFVSTNVTGTFNVLEAARAHWEQSGRPDGFRFVHVSTDEVFGSLGLTGQFRETTAYAPNSPYAASKAASDHLARAWGATYGLPVIVTNCSNNYGPRQFPEKLIPKTIQMALSGGDIPIYGTGTNVRDWLFVEDHAQALMRVLTHGRAGRSYAIGGSAEARNIDLVTSLCAILDRLRPGAAPYACQISFVTDRLGHDRRYAIDSARIRDELGWQPQTTLSRGLDKTVRWYLDHDDFWGDPAHMSQTAKTSARPWNTTLAEGVSL